MTLKERTVSRELGCCECVSGAEHSMHAKAARHHEIHNPCSSLNGATEVFPFPLGFWIKCIVIVEQQAVGVLVRFLVSIMKEGSVGVNAQAR